MERDSVIEREREREGKTGSGKRRKHMKYENKMEKNAAPFVFYGLPSHPFCKIRFDTATYTCK